MNKNELLDSIFNQSAENLVLNEAAITCSRTSTLFEVAETLAKHNIGSIIIVENNRPVGIFTERDWLRKIATQNLDLKGTPIEAYMTQKPICVPVNAAVFRIMAAMRLGRFRHVILTKPDGTLAGVVSIKDILNFLGDTLNEARV